MSCRSPVLKGDGLGVPHFNFLPAFHAIGLHLTPPIISLPSRVTNLRVFVNSFRRNFNGILLLFFKTGDGDIHSFVSTVMFSAAFGKEFIVTKRNKNKAYRQKGKIINFFISFGGSSYTLSQTLKISEKEAQELIDAFYKGFPDLKIMFEKCKKFALNIIGRDSQHLAAKFLKRDNSFNWEMP